jgi:hypothetical protein
MRMRRKLQGCFVKDMKWQVASGGLQVASGGLRVASGE